MNEEPDFYIDSDEKPSKPTPIQVSDDHKAHHADMVESSRKEYIKFGGVILLLLLAATLMSGLTAFNIEEWSRWFMGGFFIVFGSFKLINYEMFVLAFSGYDILAKKNKIYAYVYPFIELLLGIFYVLNFLAVPRDIFTIIIMGIGAAGVIKAIMHKSHIQCACLGTIIRLPLTTVSAVENITMATMAFIMLLTNLFA